MSPLVRELLVNGLMAGTAVRTAKKTTTSIAYWVVAGGIGFVAFVFFTMAGYGFLLETYSMPVAAAITGAVVLAIAASVGGFGYLKMNSRKPVRKSMGEGNIIDSIENTAKSLLSGIEDPVRDNPKMAMILAALAGFAAADQIGEKIH